MQANLKKRESTWKYWRVSWSDAMFGRSNKRSCRKYKRWGKGLETKNNSEGAEGEEIEENAIYTEEKDLIIAQKTPRHRDTKKVNEKSAETITAKINI